MDDEWLAQRRGQPSAAARHGEDATEDATEEATRDATGAAKGSTVAEPGKGGSARKRGSFFRELPVLVLIALGLALLIKTFLVQAFFIPSGSMEPTLHGCVGCTGDRVLVNKLVYDLRDIKRGEIVVFNGLDSFSAEVTVQEPTNPVALALYRVSSWIGFAPAGEKDFIKRVIGVPGDRVRCCDGKGRVSVNGVALNERDYLFEGNAPSDVEFDVRVPEGRLWVMGDHRAASADSRAHLGDPGGGTVPADKVIGRAFVVIWPPDRIGGLPVPETFEQSGLVDAAASAVPLMLGAGATLPLAAWRRRRAR